MTITIIIFTKNISILLKKKTITVQSKILLFSENSKTKGKFHFYQKKYYYSIKKNLSFNKNFDFTKKNVNIHWQNFTFISKFSKKKIIHVY